MKDLIERLEELDAPCREADQMIHDAVYADFLEGSCIKDISGRWRHPEFGLISVSQEYTASIDAALTLIPEGWEWNDGHISRDGGDYMGQTHVVRELARGRIFAGFHKLAAVSICIASIQARQSIIGGER